ncbi:hypothetical protein ABW20_dc0102909 [Dactylellina cionopaga]|nr:hypothetical protein ABW20_dc0102909 [Dactylellina cionopaga]
MSWTRKAIVGDTEIDVAVLEVIDLKLLLENNESERLKLHGASQSPGFFYVDLKDSEEYFTDVNQLYSITERYFTQPEEVKLKDFVEDDAFRGNDLDNKEIWLPLAIQPDAPTVRRFISQSHEVGYAIISQLSKSLWPDSMTRLEDKHRLTKLSKSSLKVYRGPTLENLADVSDNSHTDEGTLTFLYTDKWGTQIKNPRTGEWAWVEAKPGHAIVNVGDTLQALSGGKFNSCLHRVSQPVAGFEERWVVSYFFRPEDDTTLAPL